MISSSAAALLAMAGRQHHRDIVSPEKLRPSDSVHGAVLLVSAPVPRRQCDAQLQVIRSKGSDA